VIAINGLLFFLSRNRYFDSTRLNNANSFSTELCLAVFVCKKKITMIQAKVNSEIILSFYTNIIFFYTTTLETPQNLIHCTRISLDFLLMKMMVQKLFTINVKTIVVDQKVIFNNFMMS